MIVPFAGGERCRADQEPGPVRKRGRLLVGRKAAGLNSVARRSRGRACSHNRHRGWPSWFGDERRARSRWTRACGAGAWACRRAVADASARVRRTRSTAAATRSDRSVGPLLPRPPLDAHIQVRLVLGCRHRRRAHGSCTVTTTGSEFRTEPGIAQLARGSTPGDDGRRGAHPRPREHREMTSRQAP